MRIHGPRASGRRRAKTAAHSAWQCCVHRYVCAIYRLLFPLCYSRRPWAPFGAPLSYSSDVRAAWSDPHLFAAHHIATLLSVCSHMLSAPVSPPPSQQCTAYMLRKRYYHGDLSRYECCAGKYPLPMNCCYCRNSDCPECLLCLEVSVVLCLCVGRTPIVKSESQYFTEYFAAQTISQTRLPGRPRRFSSIRAPSWARASPCKTISS